MEVFTACPCSDLPLLLCHKFKRDLGFVNNNKAAQAALLFIVLAGFANGQTRLRSAAQHA